MGKNIKISFDKVDAASRRVARDDMKTAVGNAGISVRTP